MSMVYEGFNATEAQKAFEEAAAEIEALVEKQKEQKEYVQDELSSNGDSTKAMSGNLGQMGANAYEEMAGFSFTELETRLRTFMNEGLKPILENDAKLVEESAALYGSNNIGA